MWSDAPNWRATLEKQEAMVERLGARLEKLAPSGRAAHLIQRFENNPVVTAYGVARDAPRPCSVEWDVWLDPQHPEDPRRAKIAHGGVWATLLARTPLARWVPGCLLGATPSAEVWLQRYAEAMLINGPPGTRVTPPPLYLDIKSTYSTSADIARFIASLRQRDVQVRGVGSFDVDQLAPLEGTDTIAFFHSFGGLRRACESGRLSRGAAAMFNASFLLRRAGGENPAYAVDGESLRTVQALQKAHALHLGFYTQEYDASARAIRTLIACANANPTIFPLGFAYGGTDSFADPEVIGQGVANQAPAAWAEASTCMVM